MQPDRIVVEVRPRADYEAVDLGFRFARSVFRPLFAAHALVVVSVALALHAALYERLWLAFLLTWWLKPLYDRVALFVLAEALFGRVPGVLETLGALPRLVARTGLVHSLTWLRLTPLRSFTAPVLQLEGLRGIARSRRASVLARRHSLGALGLFFVCGIFELAIYLAGFQLAASFRPEGEAGSFWLSLFQSDAPAVSVYESLLYVLALCAVEPLYVAGGFALYVNRRVWLEGWDIDLAFKKLEARARAAALATLCVGLLCSGAARADEHDCRAGGPQHAAACIDAVLADPEFSTVEKIELWLPKSSEPDETGGEPGVFARFMLWLAEFGATLLRIGAWLALALVALGLAVAIARSLRERRAPERAREGGAPAVRFGLDLRPESLPADVIAAARAAFAAGDAAGALSLLYRGALVRLVNGFALRLPASATEGECERIARARLAAPLAQDFSALTRAWVFCAYAHQPPDGDEFAELCQRWSAHLGGAA